MDLPRCNQIRLDSAAALRLPSGLSLHPLCVPYTDTSVSLVYRHVRERAVTFVEAKHFNSLTGTRCLLGYALGDAILLLQQLKKSLEYSIIHTNYIIIDLRSEMQKI